MTLCSTLLAPIWSCPRQGKARLYKRPVRAGNASWGIMWCWFYFTKWHRVFSHTCAPRLALGLWVFRAWEGWSLPTAPHSSQEVAEYPLFGAEGFRKGFYLPLSNGVAAMVPVLEGAEPHGNQLSPAHTKTPVWPGPLSHKTPGSPVSPVSVLNSGTCVQDRPIERKFDLQRSGFFQVHFLPNSIFLLIGSKLEISTIYRELRL